MKRQQGHAGKANFVGSFGMRGVDFGPLNSVEIERRESEQRQILRQQARTQHTRTGTRSQPDVDRHVYQDNESALACVSSKGQHGSSQRWCLAFGVYAALFFCFGGRHGE
jgi:hypothetical protein